MGKFLNGLLLGVGVGLLVAPRRGEEMRQLVGENLGKVRGSLPENIQNVRFMPGRSSSNTISDVEEYYQPEASKAANKPLATSASVNSAAQSTASTSTSPAQTGSSGMVSHTPEFLKDTNKPGGTSLSGTQRPLNTNVNDPATRPGSSAMPNLQRPNGYPGVNDPRKPLNPDNRPSVSPNTDTEKLMPRPEKRDPGSSF